MIAEIASGTSAGCIQRPVDKYPHLTGALIARERDMVPGVVRDAGAAAQRLILCRAGSSKGDLAAIQRDAEVAVIARAKNITVNDDVAGCPTVAAGRAAAAGIIRRAGFHPKFDGEIQSDISGNFRVIKFDLDAIHLVRSMPIKAERRSRPRLPH